MLRKVHIDVTQSIGKSIQLKIKFWVC